MTPQVTFTHVLLADIPTRAPRWFWSENGHDRIPAGVLVTVAGREGTGKSSFAYWLAAHLSRGTLPGVFLGQPQNVSVIDTENDWAESIGSKLRAAGVDPLRVGRCLVGVGGHEVTPELPDHGDLLEQYIRDHSIRLLIIDPLMSMMGAGVDTHRERDVRRALEPLKRIAERTKCTIVCICHFNKSTGADPSSMITGSGAFKNVPRAIFGAAVSEEGGYLLQQLKNSLGRLSPAMRYQLVGTMVDCTDDVQQADVGVFTFTGETDETVEDALARRVETREERVDRNEVQSWLIDHLGQSGGSDRVTDVYAAARRAGYSEKQVQNARLRCRNPKIVTQREGMGPGGRSFWSIEK